MKTDHDATSRLDVKTAVIFLLAAGLAVFFLFGSAAAVSAKPIQMGVVTGGPTGTYYQFGLDLQNLLKPANIDLRVDNTNGSVENIYAVYQRPQTQLGIVQSDVLAFVSKVQTNPVLKGIAKKTKMVFPLYNEEIHLVGKPDILGFDYLTGRRVAIGKDGSGTFMTAELLFKVSGIEPAEKLTLGTSDALSELKKGNIDAMFYVAGYPVKLFTDNVMAEDGLSIIPITNKSILEFYPPSEIPANAYSWQSTAVSTAAVKAVLVSYDFKQYHCRSVGQAAKLIYEKMDWLKENGHPKWQSVDLNYPLKGWEQYDCVKSQLTGTRMTASSEKAKYNPVMDAIREMLTE